MIVNPDVDVYTKTLIHRKTLRKTQKKQPTENQKNAKYRNMSGVRFLHLACQRGGSQPRPLVSYATAQQLYDAKMVR